MDPFVRRFERDAVIACALMALTLFFWPGGGWWSAVSVVAGGGLVAFGYWGVKGAVNHAMAGQKPGALALVKFFTRYAILAFVAYVMLARLRVSPVGLMVGVSSPVVAACAAAARTVIPARRPGNPR